MNSERFIQFVLDEVETRESRLLVWGVVDVYLSREELFDLVDVLLEDALETGFEDEGYLQVDGVIDALLDRGVLFLVGGAREKRYRSRMAETVRLLFYLRQLFPNHQGRDAWQHARTLVSDFRFLRRPRKYPRRDISGSEALKRVTQKLANQGALKALQKLILDREGSFQLSDFQIRAAQRILRGIEARRYCGTLVSAGTGSGKTIAFYFPVLSKIASEVMRQGKGRNWVKCLALYPRTELLKDQFTEVYREARRLDGLTAKNGRKIRIAAFFGATPYQGQNLIHDDPPKWRRMSDGYICGFMSCPDEACGGDLVWRNEDIQREKECLICNTCGYEISDDEVILTRKSLETNSPDILFTTTEMLNQRLADNRYRHLFGLRPQAVKPPNVVLLDEVHTYSGFHGAQVAFLLRRWLYLVRSPMSFVGLSATIKDGKNFFARITSLYEDQVEEIFPKRSDIESEGAEYLLALKGDPVSKTSLLSTTIQTAMLLSRMLDQSQGLPSDGIFGSKMFAFTDDLDVLNRLYFSLLDAEGRNSSGAPDMARHPRGGLAVLRTPIPSESRDRNGQNWTVPQHVGHGLNERKRVGRVSSQDPGVVNDLDIVVASSSLEVGFNDSTVGAVIQHKAPRSVASFLQRKGRAGRSRKMRPWTVLVLSDYGRDRLSYQAYDRLFDPELSVQELPISSRYIQHIQAVYALVDYLGYKGMSSLGKGSVWTDLSRPIDKSSKWYGNHKRRQDVLIEQLNHILGDVNACAELEDYLSRALKITEAETCSVLWEHPRPIFTTVVPTALRRLETNWESGGQPASDFKISNSPLPEFAPSTLFNELNLPEVQIVLPPDWDGKEARKPETMPIAQALRAFAPGRVSRRFGQVHASVRHWVGPENVVNSPGSTIDIDTFYECDSLGEWQVCEQGTVASIPVFRPFEILPIKPGRQIKDTSNAQLDWHTQIVTPENENRFAPPNGSMWAPIIMEIEAFTHGQHNPIEMRRFTTGSKADIQVERQSGFRTQFFYTKDEHPAALGFSISVDALRFQIRLTADLISDLGDETSETLRGLRTERFFDLVHRESGIPSVQNPFMRQWLGTVFFAGLTFDALSRKITLEEAAAALETGQGSISLSDILDTLFQSSAVAQEEEPIEDEQHAQHQDRLREELQELLRGHEVVADLHRLAKVLWDPVDTSWQDWLSYRFKSTIAAAIFNAISNLCPDIESDGLVVDIDPGPGVDDKPPSIGGDDAHAIWISENSPGGSGHVEEFLTKYADEPRRFYSLLTAALQPNEHELIDFQLYNLLNNLVGDDANEELIDCVDSLRRSESSDGFEEALFQLRKVLTHHDFIFFHSFSTALNNRLIRSGSSVDTDNFLYEIISLWKNEESRLGVELDARAIGYLFSHDNRIDHIVSDAGFNPPTENVENWRFNVIYGMLWPRGSMIRKQGLDLYNPFAEIGAPEPLLVKPYISGQAHKVTLDDGEWENDAVETLARSGIVTLVCKTSHRQALSNALNYFATNSVPSGYLSVFARLSAMRRIGDDFEVDLEISEVSL